MDDFPPHFHIKRSSKRYDLHEKKKAVENVIMDNLLPVLNT